MINALSFGAPPHGGIAPGLNRMIMLLADEKNIREITFSTNESKCSRLNDESSSGSGPQTTIR